MDSGRCQRNERSITHHAEVLREEIDCPVFIFELPRTAKTAMQAMLCADPYRCNLRDWDDADPVPPPVLCEGQPAWSYTRWLRNCDMTSTYAYYAPLPGARGIALNITASPAA